MWLGNSIRSSLVPLSFPFLSFLYFTHSSSDKAASDRPHWQATGRLIPGSSFFSSSDNLGGALAALWRHMRQPRSTRSFPHWPNKQHTFTWNIFVENIWFILIMHTFIWFLMCISHPVVSQRGESQLWGKHTVPFRNFGHQGPHPTAIVLVKPASMRGVSAWLSPRESSWLGITQPGRHTFRCAHATMIISFGKWP